MLMEGSGRPAGVIPPSFGVWSSSASLRLTVGVDSQSLSLIRRRCGVCAPIGLSSSLTSSSDSYIVIKSPVGLQGVLRCLLGLLITSPSVGVGVVLVIGWSFSPGVP